MSPRTNGKQPTAAPASAAASSCRSRTWAFPAPTRPIVMSNVPSSGGRGSMGIPPRRVAGPTTELCRLDGWTEEIERLTRGIRALRIVHQLIHRRDVEMGRLIEIKGLGADVASVKKGIGELRSVAAELNTEGAAFKAELNDL